MSLELGIIAALTLLLGFQQIYWSRIVLKLTDRLMSRNYSDFALSKKYLNNKIKTKAQDLTPKDDFDPHADRQAQELNSIMGMI